MVRIVESPLMTRHEVTTNDVIAGADPGVRFDKHDGPSDRATDHYAMDK